MPTLGLNPSRSSIINLDSCVDRLLHRHDTSQTSRPPGAPTGTAFGDFAPRRRPQRIPAAMKASQFFISTLKEAPADAEVVSHRLMLRAGFIKRLSAGIYTYMPMGLRVIRKVEAIVREEMNRAGAVELLMPVVQPAELWQESGPLRQVRPRADAGQGPARARLRDPADQRGGHHRHRPPGAAQLPRAAEEFLSHPDQVPRRAPAALRRDARARVHDEGRLLLRPRSRRRAPQLRPDVRRLRAHLRAHGPDLSRRRRRHRRDRRHPLARVPGDRRDRRGRDRLQPGSDYAANIELAEALAPAAPRAAPPQPLAKTPTPGKSTCEDVAALARPAARRGR